MGMRNHTYRLEVQRQSGGDLKVVTAEQLVKINQHAHRYETVDKAAFSAVMNGPKASRRTVPVSVTKRSKSSPGTKSRATS